MLALDHIVVPIVDVEKMGEEYSKKYAIKTIKGGKHEEWGTYNYLSYFSNSSYVEFLGIEDIEVAKNSENPLIKHYLYAINRAPLKPFQFGLRTSDLNEFITHFKINNIQYKGPFTGSRKRTDGSVITWKMLFPSYEHTETLLPFLIEWGDLDDVYEQTSLMNAQSITQIHIGGIDRDTFAHIYKLKPSRLNKSQIKLINTKLIFTENERLRFTFS